MSGILEKINEPSHLARLNLDSLRSLCGELRERILSTTGANGGHLASNLGVVELTVALLRRFDPVNDRIVWDTGHQCYAWKLLTGRRDQFHTLRQTDGIAGFIKPEESPCDAFGTGHAGTAISAALGMAAARDREQSAHHVVAVVGDAACCNGVSLEALNNIAETTGRFILILNDNEMSIGGSVGAMTRYFGRLLANKHYNRWKGLVERLAARMRMTLLRKPYHRMEEALKSLVLENAWFEELGLRYIGPIDGHDLQQLEAALAVAMDYESPIVLHVATRKGKGFAPAETNPEFWHSAGKFNPATGEALASSGKKGYSDIFGDCLCRMAEREKRLVGITAAMSSGTGMVDFARRFKDRFFDVGICEGHALTFAAGLAAAGYRPVVALYATFMQRAVDSVLHDICLQKLPVILCLDRAGAVGSDGPTHHGLFDIALLRATPGLVIMQPRDERQLSRMLETALALDGPSLIRYPRGSGPGTQVPDSIEQLPLGRSEITLAPSGGEARVWFWALGDMQEIAMQAVRTLDDEDGVRCGVVDPCFVKPLDEKQLARQAGGADLIVTMENASRANGFGSCVLECLSDKGLKTPVLRIGWPDHFIPHGDVQELMRRCGLDVSSVVRRVRAVLDLSPGSAPKEHRG